MMILYHLEPFDSLFPALAGLNRLAGDTPSSVGKSAQRVFEPEIGELAGASLQRAFSDPQQSRDPDP